MTPRLGELLGQRAVTLLEEHIKTAEKKEARKKRDREINRARRQGKTIRYRREEE